ncbi:uncharacterized protein PSFLO_03428 [Pseudozyma flocculosa]|uniref:Palmitoyltransferase n=1 Tax=Pseudozyma flocculosa TaxID=84751 RepID=A0A5C3F3U5_9BASI|nr:uncharacterized protein PSFLO_03428 [Pseudozyma flocculosa]
MRSVAKLVHVSFRTVERAADWLTGSAGPVFIAICIILVVGGIWTFFSSMFPQLAQAPPELVALFQTHSPAHVALGLAPSIYNSFKQTPAVAAKFFAWLSVCLFIILSIGWHYYMACTEPPGTVLEGLGDSNRERRTGPGSSIWWSRYRKRASKASGPAVPRLASTATVHPGKGADAETAFEPASPIRPVASLEDLRKGSSDSQRASRSSNAAGAKMAHLISSSRSSSHRSSSSQSSITLSSPRLAKSPLPISMQEAELRLPGHVDAELESDVDDEDDDMFPLARMCHKCPKVPLWKALSVLPPELRQIERRLRSKKPKSTAKPPGDSYVADNEDDEGEAEIRAWLGDEEAEKLDHHCPWINGCVGIGNERYFVLFMTWLSIGCAVVTASGWRVVRETFEFRSDWPYPYTPRVFVLLLYVLAVVMGFALAVMAGWQLLIVARGETSVESNDNAYYRELAAKRGQDFDNVYDVGAWKNLQLFFNVGPGSPFRYHTILLPKRIPPYSDGWHWAKKRGLGGRHAGVKAGEELTDEEVEYDDHADVYRPSPSSVSNSSPVGDGQSE